jgi:hypothetical protein
LNFVDAGGTLDRHFDPASGIIRIYSYWDKRSTCVPSHAGLIILQKTQPPVGLVIVVLLRKTWQISESLSGDNEAISVDGFRVLQHQKRVLVKNLLR